jgi:hypothetical protein
MDLFYYYILSFLIVILLFVLRNNDRNLSQDGKNKTGEIVSWCIIIFGIILGFTIANFYNRYIETREILVNEIVNLQIIYRTFKVLPDNQKVIKSIKNYVKSVINDLQYSLQNNVYSIETSNYYRIMDSNIIEYFNEYKTNPFISTINNRLSTSERIKILSQEVITGNFYILMLWFLFIFILIPLYFLKMPDKFIQLLIEFCLLSMFLTGIYLCTTINNPFIESPIMLKFTMYEDLLDEINL